MQRCRTCFVAMCLLALTAYGLPAVPVMPDGQGEAWASEIIDKEGIVSRIKPRTRGIKVEPADQTPKVALSAIQFELNSARFTNLARKQVRELGKALASPELLSYSFILAGHTDSSGSRAYNRDLSLRRAQAVKKHLVDTMGIDGSRLVEVGLGEDYTIAGLPPEDARNRRVEVTNVGVLPPRFSADDVHRRTRARRALIVGIDSYEQVAPLKGPVNDARAMAAYIVEHAGFEDSEVRMLLDADATREKILSTIEHWLIDGTKAGDEVFLYYSGHGFQQPDTDNDETDKLDETLVPVDAYFDGEGAIKGMIADDEVAGFLKHLANRRVRVIIDACHSGTGTRSAGLGDWRYMKVPRRPDGSPLRVALPRTRGLARVVSANESLLENDDPNVEVWTAVRADQVALIDREAGDGAGSVFTRRLLWGVRDGKADRNDDGTVTVAELHRYVTDSSNAYCQKYRGDCSRGLTPQIQIERGRLGATALKTLPPPVSRTAKFAKDLIVRPAPTAPPVEERRVQVRVAQGSRLSLGSEIDIEVTSEVEGYLVVLDLDTNGNVVQIFPNDRSRKGGVSSRVRAGETVRLPGKDAGFRFRAVPPTGRGLLLAVVSDGNDRLREFTGRYKDLNVVAAPEPYLAELVEALRSGDGAESSRPHWVTGTFEYEIVSAKREF